MSVAWTIQCSAGAVSSATSFADLNLSNLVRQLNSQTADSVSFLEGASFDSDLLFPFDSIITIKRDGVAWFAGRVAEPQRVGEPGSESLRWTAFGPWRDLEECVFQQTWPHVDSETEEEATGLRSRVILCQDDDGLRINSGQQISAALAYAITRGANLAVGTISPAIEIPWEEATDITVAEVIQRMLRWSPDCVAAFDYSTTPPTFHVRARSGLSAASFAIGSAPLSACAVAARRDLQVPGVLLRYERQDTLDEEVCSIVIPDTAGTITGLKTVISTIQLAGSSTTTLSQRITTEAWPSDLASKAWWKAHIPRLKEKDDANIGISAVTVTELDEDGEVVGELNRATYHRILLSGTVQPWMSSVETRECIVKAKLAEFSGEGEYVPGTDDDTAEIKDISFKCIATDAETGTDHDRTYHTVGNSVSGEPIPTGVAAALYAAWNQLQYAGSISLLAEDVGATSYLSRKLNLTGGRSEWASMNALVVGQTDEVDGGRTTLTLGPAKRVSPDDLISLLFRFRSRRIATGWNLRKDPKGSAVEVRSGGPAAKNEPSEGAPLFSKLRLKHKTDGTEDARLVLDPAEVKDADDYKVFQKTTDDDDLPTTQWDYLRAHD